TVWGSPRTTTPSTRGITECALAGSSGWYRPTVVGITLGHERTLRRRRAGAGRSGPGAAALPHARRRERRRQRWPAARAHLRDHASRLLRHGHDYEAGSRLRVPAADTFQFRPPAG